jgi:hypothetical protein
MEIPRPKTVGEIDGFVTLLLAACDEPKMSEQIEKVLELPDANRRAVVQAMVINLQNAGAPRDLTVAIGCLTDDIVAEKAYEVIFKCRRGEKI